MFFSFFVNENIDAQSLKIPVIVNDSLRLKKRIEELRVGEDKEATLENGIYFSSKPILVYSDRNNQIYTLSLDNMPCVVFKESTIKNKFAKRENLIEGVQPMPNAYRVNKIIIEPK